MRIAIPVSCLEKLAVARVQLTSTLKAIMLGVTCIHAFSLNVSAQQVGPWDIDALKSDVPSMKWLRQDQPIHSLTYAGEKVKGRDTEVFAFYASPKTLGETTDKTTFPGIVLIHGGGGTAFSQWVHLWAKRGYAAIAMDLSGSRPADPVFDEKTGEVVGGLSRKGSRKRLANGGLNHGHAEKFDSIGGDTSDDWPFHAVASVMRAHTLLGSFPEVDAQRTAVTGISWGGYTTCLVASLDNRFKAAVPVYGCGFLHEGESVQKPAIEKLGDRKDKWVKLYDPGSHLPNCRVPILFVNGTNDVHYVLDSYMKSYNVVPGEKRIRIELNMRHGHTPGWAPKEIGMFIDSKCLLPPTKSQLPEIGKLAIKGDCINVSCSFKTGGLKSAFLLYTSDSGLRSKRRWKSIPCEAVSRRTIVSGKKVATSYSLTAPKPPAEANTWFITVTNNDDAMISSEVQFRPGS